MCEQEKALLARLTLSTHQQVFGRMHVCVLCGISFSITFRLCQKAILEVEARLSETCQGGIRKLFYHRSTTVLSPNGAFVSSFSNFIQRTLS